MVREQVTATESSGAAEVEVTVLYLFDIDGTLLHAHGSGRGAFDAVMEAHHGIANASEGIRYGGKTDPAIVDEIFAARLGRPPTEPERAAFLDAYVPRLRDLLAEHRVEVIAGVVSALDFLATQPAVLGLATGNIRAGAEPSSQRLPVRGRFAVGGYGCDALVRAELAPSRSGAAARRGATGEARRRR